MKSYNFFLNCLSATHRLSTALTVLICMNCAATVCRAQQPEGDSSGTQVLTRGPVHEAFAGIVTYNPEPGIVVTKAPPDAIQEVPPDQKPEGDNVTWIPGYWAWDDERSDFLWVSGTWRAIPPGRSWMAGYWGKTTQGYQWTSGYWADSTAQETTYLPAPPPTVETGPNIEAPSVDYGWAPGCWIWYEGHYAWRPGYWVEGREDWDWTPDHYIWTPRGYIFVGGFWDYPVERRGIIFAPVYFEAGVYSRQGYYYSPSIVIDLGVFNDHLFLRPRYNHYYFGDYYGSGYQQGGFYASVSFGVTRGGYDPIYSHQRWEHRQDREWEHRTAASYQYRRDNVAARPARTWAAQKNINPNTAGAAQNHGSIAMPINQLARSKDSTVRWQPVAAAERQNLAKRGQEVQQSREQRRTLETRTTDTAATKPGGKSEPIKVQTPRSPIAANPATQSGKTTAPPLAQQSLKPELKAQPQNGTPGAQSNVIRNNPQASPGSMAPEKNQAVRRENPVQPQPAVQPEKAVTPAPARQTPNPSQPATPPHQPDANRNNPQPGPGKPATEKKQAPPQNEAATSEKQTQSEPARDDSKGQSRENPQRSVRESDRNTQQDQDQGRRNR